MKKKKREKKIRVSYKVINFTPKTRLILLIHLSSLLSFYSLSWNVRMQQSRYKNQCVTRQLMHSDLLLCKSWSPAVASALFNSIWIAAQENLLLCSKQLMFYKVRRCSRYKEASCCTVTTCSTYERYWLLFLLLLVYSDWVPGNHFCYQSMG